MKIVTGYTGEKHIAAADDQGFNAGVVSNGLVVLPIGGQFRLTYSGSAITLSDGEGVFQGVHFRSSGETLTIGNPSSGYRCTVIYIQYTKSNQKESISLLTKDGASASSQDTVVVPTVTSGNIRAGATKAEAVLFRVYSSASGIYKTEMACDVVSSLSALTAGVSALNSNLASITFTRGIATPSGLNVTLPGNYRGVLIILDGPKTRCGLYLIRTYAAGQVNATPIFEPTEVTIDSTTANQIVITSPGSSVCVFENISGTATM